MRSAKRPGKVFGENFRQKSPSKTLKDIGSPELCRLPRLSKHFGRDMSIPSGIKDACRTVNGPTIKSIAWLHHPNPLPLCRNRYLYDTACSIIRLMTQTDKLLERMRNNPRDWPIESLEMVAKRFGIVVRKPPGVHIVFQHEASALEVSVPAHRPIKPVYIKQFLALIDDIRS